MRRKPKMLRSGSTSRLPSIGEPNFSASIRSALLALQLDPTRATAYNNIGAAYAALHEWEEAVHFERAALRRDPRLQIAQNDLNLFLRRAGPPAAPIGPPIN